MRLLILTNDFPPTIGGIENYMFSLARRWVPSDLTVITRWVPGCEEFDKELAFEVIRVPVGTLLPDGDLRRLVLQTARRIQADVMHVATSLPLGLLGPVLLREQGVPYAVNVHGGEFLLPSHLPFARSLLRRVLNEAAVVMGESTRSNQIVREFFELPPPTELVTCGVDVERYGPGNVEPASIEADGPVLVSVSRLIARKGPATLIAAMPAILERHPSAHALIVGGGPDLGRLQKLASSLFVSDSVTFAGPQPWAEVPRWYAAGDIFVLPTRERFGGIETEGLPLSYVEAAASGLPLIGGRAGGVEDAVREDETGFIVDGSSHEETAQAVNLLLDDPELAKTLGHNARTMAEKEFSWDVIFPHYFEVLSKYAG